MGTIISLKRVSAVLTDATCRILFYFMFPSYLFLMEQFVEGLDSGSVSRVALFSSNGYGTDQFAALREKLKAKGIEVEAGAFSCKGSAFIFKNMGKPDQEDLEAAKRFALSVRDGRRS